MQGFAHSARLVARGFGGVHAGFPGSNNLQRVVFEAAAGAEVHAPLTVIAIATTQTPCRADTEVTAAGSSGVYVLLWGRLAAHGNVILAMCGLSADLDFGDPIEQGQPIGRVAGEPGDLGNLSMWVGRTYGHEHLLNTSFSALTDPFGFDGPGEDDWVHFRSHVPGVHGGPSEWLWLPASEGGFDERPPCGPDASWIDALPSGGEP